jgi:hypothetical protein
LILATIDFPRPKELIKAALSIDLDKGWGFGIQIGQGDFANRTRVGTHEDFEL